MSILRQARLVRARKHGRWMYYRLPEDDCPKEVARAVEWVRTSLARDKQITADARQIKRVSKMDKEKLCEHYKK
jgi:ArsR family transcriptional regulator